MPQANVPEISFSGLWGQGKKKGDVVRHGFIYIMRENTSAR